MLDLKYIRRRLGWELRPESSVRDYLWGLVILAFGLFTVIGMFFLFGG